MLIDASRAADYMAQMGWEPYQNDHEDANGQFEARAPAAGRERRQKHRGRRCVHAFF